MTKGGRECDSQGGVSDERRIGVYVDVGTGVKDR